MNTTQAHRYRIGSGSPTQDDDRRIGRRERELERLLHWIRGPQHNGVARLVALHPIRHVDIGREPDPRPYPFRHESNARPAKRVSGARTAELLYREQPVENGAIDAMNRGCITLIGPHAWREGCGRTARRSSPRRRFEGLDSSAHQSTTARARIEQVQRGREQLGLLEGDRVRR